MVVLRTLKNVRTFSRRLFEFLSIILNETRATKETVRILEYNLGFAKTSVDMPLQLQRIGELVATNNLISKRLASGSVALNDFCDEATQLLLSQQRQIETLLSVNQVLMERAQTTGRLVERLVPVVERMVPAMERVIPALEHSQIPLTEAVALAKAEIEQNTAMLKGQDQRLFALEEIVKAQATILPSWHATPEAAAEIRDVLRLLAPRAAASSAKRRFGRDFDGGYVMLEDFNGAGAAISLGINDDVSWDLDVAHRGLEIFQFDHTIVALPDTHERFHFNPLRIAATPAAGAVTLEQAFRMAEVAGTSPVILKMDIEGDEWDVLDTVPEEMLDRCNQIIIEFHHMERLLEPASLSQARRVFEKLSRGFFLCHVHGNNCGNLVNLHNIVLPETLEMTFAKTAVYPSVETHESFPQRLDSPNQPGRADFFLGAFKF